MRLAVVSCALAFVLPSAASAGGCPARAGGAWLAVFGQTASPQAALKLQARVRGLGWTRALVARRGPRAWEVVVYGYPTQADVAGTQLEAQRVGLQVVPRTNIVACGDNNGVWEAVFSYERTPAAARTTLKRIRALGFTGGSHIESEGPGRIAVVVEGFNDVDELDGFAREARRAGYVVGFRPS